MNVVDTLNFWPRLFNGSRARNGGILRKLNKKQREAVRDLQQTWFSMALQVINSPKSSDGAMVLGITSAIDGEGKTTNCLGLGSAIAREADERVLLIECDIGNPTIASQMDLEPTPGLVEYIQAGCRIEDTVRQTNLPNFDVIVHGGERTDEPDSTMPWNQPLLSRLRRNLPNIITASASYYGYILLDMPPVLNNPYTKDIVNLTDSTYLSAMASVTPVDCIELSVRAISEDKLSGVLLTGADSPLPSWLHQLISE